MYDALPVWPFACCWLNGWSKSMDSLARSSVGVVIGPINRSLNAIPPLTISSLPIVLRLSVVTAVDISGSDADQFHSPWCIIADGTVGPVVFGAP